jgi:hypothetical protein
VGFDIKARFNENKGGVSVLSSGSKTINNNGKIS